MKLFSAVTGKLWLFMTLLALAGCGGGSHSFEFPAADDPPPGPGLFSGPDGTFTIYRSNSKEDAEEAESPAK